MEVPYIPYLTLYFISSGIWSRNTKCATHWRFEHGEVNAVVGEEESIWDKDPLFRILADPWPTSKAEKENTFVNIIPILTGTSVEPPAKENSALIPAPLPASGKFKAASLTCGEPVNETTVDHLEGIAERLFHPSYPEPEVALLFRKNEFDNVQADVIEVNLLDALKSGENKLILFNQIGNFLRMKGDTYHAIECFRSALIIAHSPDVLLNLARMLLNLNYIKDAIYLAERSLDQHSPEQSTWLQHFTLGEILEKNGEYERALSHFQMALDQSPAFHPAQLHLKKLGNVPAPATSNLYTFCIISALCSFILFYLYFTIIKEPEETNTNYNYKRSGFFKPSKSLT